MMKYSDLIRVLLFPLLFPLSVVYSLIAFFNRIFSKAYRPKSLVVSIGNFQVGGTGKSPLIIELIKQIKNKKLQPVVISKSYKALLKSPKQVLSSDRALEVGDEALMIKKNFPEVLVFSGPSKVQTLKFAEKELAYSDDNVFLLDDGAQHHKLKKDINVILWDASRSLFDLFSFPLGMSRECLFLGVKPDNLFLTRDSEKTALGKVLKYFYGARLKSLNYKIQAIENHKHESLQKNAHLVSGVGNFRALKSNVSNYLKEKGLKLKSEYKASDHDTFKDFKTSAGEFYICTEKDHDKLRDKVNNDHLYVVKSFFDESSKKDISGIVKAIEEKISDDKNKV